MVTTIAADVGAVERATALARDFATRAGLHDRDGSFPFENFAALREARMLGLTIPVERGGDGQGLTAACTVIGEIAKGDASTALVLAMHYIYHALFATRWPDGVGEEMWASALGEGGLINVCRVEPELGTPARGGLPATVAEPVPGGWRITGRKIYTTGAPMLRWFIVFGRTAGDDPRVGYFIVPNDSPGVRIEETWDQMGMRATGSHDLVMESVEIPERYAFELRSPTAGPAMDPAMAAWNSMVLSSLYLGVATAARDWLTGYLKERTPANLGAPLATLPRFQMAVGEIEALLFAARRLVFGVASDAEAGRTLEPNATSLAKFVATNNAIRAVDIALGLVGNPGLSRTHPLERHHRDVLCSRIHTPQDDMITGIAGRLALGLA